MPSSKRPSSTKATEFPESLVWAIVAVSVGGLALIIALMAVMKNELHFDNQLILLISLLSFLLLLAAESVFIWLLLSFLRRAKRDEQTERDLSQLQGTATKELLEPREPFLSQAALSVTEQTTRTLDPVERERPRDNNP